MVERETLEPIQPEWGQPERWSFDAPEDGVILDSREVEISPAIPSVETIDEETGEIQMSLPQEAVFKTEFLLPAEYEIKTEDVTSRIEQERINAEALAYLQSTDWMAMRFADSGEQIPQSIREKRAEARARIVKL